MISLFASPKHFETGNYNQGTKKPPTLLNDEEYGRALDALVKACTDLIVQNSKGEILLGKRNVFPQKDWWFGCGGRMRPGETPYTSAARLLKRELGIILEEKDMENVSQGGRLFGIGHYSFLWEMREQAPQNHGTADISTVLSIELTDTEADSLKLDSKEYGENAWISCQDILEGDFHPAMKQCIRDLIATKEINELRILASNEKTSDAELGKRFRELIDQFEDKKSLVNMSLANGTKKQRRL